MKKKTLSTLALLAATAFGAFAQNPFEQFSNMFTTPLNYVVGHTKTAPVIDGNINDEVWEKAEWTSYFQDIEGDLKPKPYRQTRVKMLWDNDYIYFAAELEEPHVWANLTERDQIVFFDNDFEIFIDPSNTTHQYFEVEINALNNIFDLFLNKPYRFQGSPLFSWNAAGMKHAVNIQGSLNNANDTDKSWTVEFAIPFTALTIGNNKHLPENGEIWRLNFSRVQWDTEIVGGKYVKKKGANGKDLPEHNWTWSDQGVIDMHRPERWGYLQFSEVEAGKTQPTFELPYSEKQRKYLWLLHYKQNAFRGQNNRFAKTLKELDMNKLTIEIDGIKNELNMQAIDGMYNATITDSNNKSIRITHEGYIQNLK